MFLPSPHNRYGVEIPSSGCTVPAVCLVLERMKHHFVFRLCCGALSSEHSVGVTRAAVAAYKRLKIGLLDWGHSLIAGGCRSSVDPRLISVTLFCAYWPVLCSMLMPANCARSGGSKFCRWWTFHWGVGLLCSYGEASIHGGGGAS